MQMWLTQFFDISISVLTAYLNYRWVVICYWLPYKLLVLPVCQLSNQNNIKISSNKIILVCFHHKLQCPESSTWHFHIQLHSPAASRITNAVTWLIPTKYFSIKHCITSLLLIFMPIIPCYDLYIKVFYWSAGLVGVHEMAYM